MGKDKPCAPPKKWAAPAGNPSCVWVPEPCWYFFLLAVPLLPFWRQRSFALCGGRLGGAAPKAPATFEKVDKAFKLTKLLKM